MPKTDDAAPKALRPYHSHGVDPVPVPGSTQALGTCPWCGKEKFYVNVETGLWDCLTGDTKILTKTGYVKIGDVAGTTQKILSATGWQDAPIRSGGIRNVLAVTMTRDRAEKTVRATPGHRWITKSGNEVTTEKLRAGDKLAYSVAPRVLDPDPEGIRHGIMFGDGNSGHVELYGPKTRLLKYLDHSGTSPLKTRNGVDGIRVNGRRRDYKKLPGLDRSPEYLLGFLMGYMSTDGTAFHQTCIDSAVESNLLFVREAADILGIPTGPVRGYWRKGFPGQEGYMYRVSFHRSGIYPEFFIRDDHRSAVEESKSWGGRPRLSWEVKSVTPAGREEVYCATVTGSETFTLEDNLLTGNCKVCGESGNDLTFIRRLYEYGADPGPQLAELKGIDHDELVAWGLKVAGGSFVLPGYDAAGKIVNIYKWGKDLKTKKWLWYATAGMKHGLLGVNLYDPAKPDVYLCEGHWDGPALRAALGKFKRAGEGSDELVRTGNPDVSLLATANVLAVPGATTWDDAWAPLFAGKRVVLCYDSDHPRYVCQLCKKSWLATGESKDNCPTCGKPAAKAPSRSGYDGMRRVSEALAAHQATIPESVHYLDWGPDGFTPELANGFDVRDALNFDADAGGNMKRLLDLVKPIPADWVGGRGKGDAKAGVVRLKPEPCDSWPRLIKAWRKALKWHDDLEHILVVSLATIMSTGTQGEQIWSLAMAPPSSGKTTIMEALAVSEKYVYCQNELGLVFSGYKTSKDDNEDHGIIPKIDGKTLIIMDGDAILRSPIRAQVFSQYRQLFDGVARKKHNNGKSLDKRCRFTKIIAGTGSLREMDVTEAGARFITAAFRDDATSDEAAERQRAISRRVAYRAVMGSKTLTNGSEESRVTPEMATAKKLTGGYVEYLRDNTAEIMARVDDPTEAVIDRIINYCEMVADLRARPSKTQDEVAEKEKPYRLVEQYTRLAMTVAGVMGKTAVDAEVLAHVYRVAGNTAGGRTYNIAAHLAKWGDLGQEKEPLRIVTGEAEEKISPLLRFMRKIGVVDQRTTHPVTGAKIPPRWHLTPRFARVWEEAHADV